MHFPRYLKAMPPAAEEARHQRHPARPAEPRQIAPRWQALQAADRRTTAAAITTIRELAHYRWMIEELRVSLFAQELGTSLPVSPQRLDKLFEKIADVGSCLTP